MSKYSTIRNALEMFSVQLGLHDDAARNLVRRSLRNSDWRISLEAELRSLVTDATAPWANLVENDRYEIDEPETDEEARQIVIDTLWYVVFPDQEPPNSLCANVRETLDSSEIKGQEKLDTSTPDG